MKIPDPIERGESSAEKRYEEMEQGDGKLKCFCGEIFDEDDGEFLSSNPYCMPSCPKCAEEYFKETRNKYRYKY